jgi:choline dehydrogenase-like flavoprotein
MVGSPINNWHFNTTPQKGFNGRIGYQPHGKGLGGSFATNAMVYIRGNRADYDHWASLGNVGWSYTDDFRRVEDNEYHGQAVHSASATFRPIIQSHRSTSKLRAKLATP